MRYGAKWMPAMLVAAWVAACGGGGGGDGPADNGGGVVVPPETAPAITTQPRSQTVHVGTAVTFTVLATGTDPKRYQWLRNGQPIAGAESYRYALSAPQLSDHNAQFALRVSNGAGSVTSDAATLRVEVSQPPGSLSFLAGGPGASPSGARESDGVGDRARFGNILGMAADRHGHLFVASAGVVRKLTPDGRATTLAGLAPADGSVPQEVDGQGTAARFGSLRGIAIGSAGQVWVSDMGGIRRIDQDGVVTTVHRVQGPSVPDAPRLRAPGALVAGADGSLYVLDAGDAGVGRRIRKIAPDGTVGNVPGGDFPPDSNGRGELRIGQIAMDGAGNIYLTMARVVDGFCALICTVTYNDGYVMKIAPDGARSAVAGTPGAPSGAQDGPAGSARFDYPMGIASTPDGTLYIADVVNNAVRRVDANGVSTVVGVLRDPQHPAAAGYVQGPLPGALQGPKFVALAGDGTLFVTAGDAQMDSQVSAETILKVDRLP